MIIIRGMPRPRSEKVHALKAKLIARLADGFHRPGDRFLSTRAVAVRHGVSYQTAHRIIAELRDEGHLERRPASGTYVAGHAKKLREVELWFHPRARRPDSFGANLLRLLERALTEAGIAHRICWAEEKSLPAATAFPVLWEVPALVKRVMAAGHYALLMNDRPSPGLAASLLDAVATDDFSAGACAAQVLTARRPRGRQFVIMSGPAQDARNSQRVSGFLSHLPRARVVPAGSWYFEDGHRVAPAVFEGKPDGVFCVNDRLAEAVLAYCQEIKIKPPALVGHDDAPVAEELHLTTIKIPWEEMVEAALTIIKSRLGGYAGPARQIILAQRPVHRLTA